MPTKIMADEEKRDAWLLLLRPMTIDINSVALHRTIGSLSRVGIVELTAQSPSCLTISIRV